MSEQRLFDPGPQTHGLTPRQQRAYTAIQAAGYDGLHTDELGALIHYPKHALNDRCSFCGTTGRELGRALRARGLVQQRRRRAPSGDTYTVWTVAGRLVRQPDRVFDLPEEF